MIKDKLKHKIERLSEDERRLLAIKINEALNNNAQASNANSKKRIVAFIKADNYLDKEAVKSYLKNMLPDYMIPSSIKILENIPLLPNGKINKKELLKTKDDTSYFEASKSDILIPKNEIETKLVEIWEDILGFSPISTSDNFFEIGGDSILSIQIVAKARKEGINLKANQLFENQTIGELAMFSSLSNETKKTLESYEELEGETPLTPVQHWFFETHKTAPHFWNQVIELQNIENVSGKILKSISKQLITNHEALRLSFKKRNNKWQAFIKSSKQVESFNLFDLNNEQNKEAQDNKIKSILLEIQENIDLAEGNLFKLLCINCNGIQPNRVILIAHHLVVDVVSWNIISNEINQAIKNAMDDFIVDDKNNKTATVKDWTVYLDKLIKNNSISNELKFWESQSIDDKKFPRDFVSDLKIYTEKSIFNYSITLDSEYTNSLIHEANEPFGTKVEDLLITSVITTLCEWRDSKQVLLGIERQGRNIDTQNVDISNTVGWFTNFFPIALGYNSSEELSQHIKNTKEKLRAIPNNGLGFGVLKYISDTNTHALSALNPKVIFNYLGKSNTIKNTKDLNFKFIESPTRDPNSERNYEIEINAQILNNELVINWSFTKELHNKKTAETLNKAFIKNIKTLISYCKTQENVNYTPSDFPEANINQDDLDNLLSQF